MREGIGRREKRGKEKEREETGGRIEETGEETGWDEKREPGRK